MTSVLAILMMIIVVFVVNVEHRYRPHLEFEDLQLMLGFDSQGSLHEFLAELQLPHLPNSDTFDCIQAYDLLRDVDVTRR